MGIGMKTYRKNCHKRRQFDSFILLCCFIIISIMISGCFGISTYDNDTDFKKNSAVSNKTSDKKNGKIGAGNTGYAEPVIEENKEDKSEINTSDSEYDVARRNIGITPENIAELEKTFSSLYAYSVMESSLHDLYTELYIIIMNEAENIRVSTDDADELQYAFKCVFEDHPEIYWIEGYSYVNHEKNRETSFLTFTGKYTYTAEERSVNRVKIDAYFANFKSGLSQNASQYDKVKYTYEYVIKNTDYVLNSPDSQNILSVFVNKKSVCQGYAKAVQYLLGQIGVECTFVTGKVETGEGHGWNLVNIDGAYYYLDATWGDSSYILNSIDASAQLDINYDYLNITTEELLLTHIVDNVVPMPLCVSNEANYFYHENLVFNGYEYNGIKNVFDRGYMENKDFVIVKGVNSVAFNDIVTNLIDNKELFKMVDSESDTITYSINDQGNYIIIWL